MRDAPARPDKVPAFFWDGRGDTEGGKCHKPGRTQQAEQPLALSTTFEWDQSFCNLKLPSKRFSGFFFFFSPNAAI